MPSLSTIVLLALAAASGAVAQSCPSGQFAYTDRNGQPACFSGVTVSGSTNVCSLYFFKNGSKADNTQDAYYLGCRYVAGSSGSWTIQPGVKIETFVAQLQVKGDRPPYYTYLTTSPFPSDITSPITINIDVDVPANGNFYTAITDGTCAAQHPSATYPAADGTDCRNMWVSQTSYGKRSDAWSGTFYQINPVGAGMLQISMQVTLPVPPVTQTTYGSTATLTSTSYTETVYTPSATFYETQTSTITETPPTSTIVEHETLNITPTAATATETVDGGVTTPPVVLVSTSTDVTTTPATSTVTSVVTPDLSTVRETSWATSTPPIKTVTSTQTVETGNPPCTNYCLVYPAECCPTQYAKLKLLGRRTVNLEKRASTVYIDGGVTTTTRTVSAVQTLPTSATTYTKTEDETTELATPLTTSTETDTVTLPQETVTVSTTTYSEAPTPTSTITSTFYHEAPTPLATSISTAPTPLTTEKVTSTTTIAQPVTTTTSTAYAQATSCAVKTIQAQTSCANSNLVGGLVQNAQVATLNLYKALGGKSVVVDCGSAGTFSY